MTADAAPQAPQEGAESLTKTANRLFKVPTIGDSDLSVGRQPDIGKDGDFCTPYVSSCTAPALFQG